MKTDLESTQSSQSSRPARPTRPTRRSPKPRALTALDGLAPDQLQQLNHWLDHGFAYDKISDLTEKEFSRRIPAMTIFRYYKRSRTRDFLDDSPESQTASREISQYAASGEANFSSATLHLLEAHAFDLARTLRPNSDLDSLKEIFLLINKAKSTAIRERHATVQERKCDLRHEEFQFRKDQAAKREAREQNIHSEPPPETDSRDWLTTFRDDDGKLLTFKQLVADDGNKEYSDTWIFRGGEDFPPGFPEGKPKEPLPWQVPGHLAAGTIDPDSVADPDPETAARFSPELIAAVKSYTARRIAEYRVYLGWGAKGWFITQHMECPCGAKSPCDIQGGFTPYFWNSGPWSYHYRTALIENGLPYCPPAYPSPKSSGSESAIAPTAQPS